MQNAQCRHAIQQRHLTPLALLRHALRAATGMRYAVFQPVLTRDPRLEMERRLFPSCLPALRGLGVGGMTTRTILRRGCVHVTHRDAVRLCGTHAPHACQQTALEADGALRLSSRGEVGIMAGVLHDEALCPTRG